MKKILPMLIFLAFLAFLYQFIVSLFITEHKVNYELITSDQKEYKITEKFKKSDKKNYYSFVIENKKDKKKHYAFSIEDNFKKDERIITDIKYYKKENLECIFPIYKKDRVYDVSCLLDGKQVSTYYLVNNEKDLFSYMIEKFDKYDYDDNYYNFDNSVTKNKQLEVYFNNIPDDYIFSVWNYKGIYLIKGDEIQNIKFLNSDYYENTLSSVVGDYYVTVNTDNEDEELNYNQFIIYNMVDEKKSVVEVSVSQSIYFNGVVDDKLFITDEKNEKQYVLNPIKGKMEELKINYKVNNGKKVKTDDSIFKSRNIDNMMVKNKEITKLYDTKNIKRNLLDYYFITSDNNLYRVIQNDYKNPILIGNFDNITEWQVKDGGVAFIAGDTLYLYTDYFGLKPVIKNNEFLYNSKNIYNFIREE